MQKLYVPIIRYFRRRRNARFMRCMRPQADWRLLDVGGTPYFWSSTDCPSDITCINLEVPHSVIPPVPNVTCVEGDALHLPYPDGAFDIAFSNSVIEHVGDKADQQRFADEIRRVGRRYWVQTPNRWFPVEPHMVALFLHYLPRRWQQHLMRWASLRGWIEKPSQDEVDRFLADIRLLTKHELRQLFPDAVIHTERFLLLPKSYVAVRLSDGHEHSAHHSLDILGTRIAATNPESTLLRVRTWLRAERSTCRYVCVTGVHGVMESHRDPEIQSVHNEAAMCVPDGVPLTWVGRLRGHHTMSRVYGPHLMLQVLDVAAREGWTNYFYGGAEGVADDLSRRMQERFPGLKVLGTHCPPFRPLEQAERTAIIEEINGLAPDIVWVGLSTPKQELLMAGLSPDINARLMFGVGAAFDFHTDRLRQAPSWIQRIGMEWCFRLCMEPRRLLGRYLRNNPAFLWLILRDAVARHWRCAQ